MQGDVIISALIGLVGAVANNGKTEHTDAVIREAFLRLQDPEREEETVRRIHDEKFTIAPDCATCKHPCGNTSDYDMAKFYATEERSVTAKRELIETLRSRLSAPEEISAALPEDIYRGIAYLGYDLEPESYEQLRNELNNPTQTH